MNHWKSCISLVWQSSGSGSSNWYVFNKTIVSNFFLYSPNQSNLLTVLKWRHPSTMRVPDSAGIFRFTRGCCHLEEAHGSLTFRMVGCRNCHFWDIGLILGQKGEGESIFTGSGDNCYPLWQESGLGRIESHAVNWVTDILSHSKPQKETHGQCSRPGLITLKLPFIMPCA